MSVHLGPAWSVQAAGPPYADNYADCDPLGTGHTHNNMTGHLLPGITPHTCRARYYVFYTWAIHQARKMRKRNLCSFKRTMYDLERLLVLSCMVHAEHVHGSSAPAACTLHLAGSREAGRVLAEHAESIPLDFAHTGSDLGGYGMYYQDSVFAMGLAEHEPEDEYERPTYLGVSVSDSFDALASGLDITSYCERESITRDALLEMGEKICLCQIKHNIPEAEQMTRVLFGLYGDGEEEERPRRAPGMRPASLALMLYAINQSGLQGHSLSSADFADIACFGHLKRQGAESIYAWPLPQLQDVSDRWGVVVAGAHRDVSYAAEAMLWLYLEFLQTCRLHDNNENGDNSTDATATVGTTAPTIDTLPHHPETTPGCRFADYIAGGFDGGIERTLVLYRKQKEEYDDGSMHADDIPHTMRRLALLAAPLNDNGNTQISGSSIITDAGRPSLTKNVEESARLSSAYTGIRVAKMLQDHLATKKRRDSGRGEAADSSGPVDTHAAAACCIILASAASMRLLWRLDAADSDPCIRWWMHMDPGGTGALHAARDTADAIIRDIPVEDFVHRFVQRHVVQRASDVYHAKLRSGVPARRWFYNHTDAAASARSVAGHPVTYSPTYYRDLRFESTVLIFEDLGLVARDSGMLRCTERGQRVLGRVLRRM